MVWEERRARIGGDRMINKESFGAAECKLVCSPDRVQLFIHGDHLVAESKLDVYTKIFNIIVKANNHGRYICLYKTDKQRNFLKII